MCIVSAIHDYGRNVLPDYWNSPFTVKTWTELIEKAKEWDELTNQPDCVDPEKEKFVQDMIKYQEIKTKEENEIVESENFYDVREQVILSILKEIRELARKNDMSTPLTWRLDVLSKAYQRICGIEWQGENE